MEKVKECIAKIRPFKRPILDVFTSKAHIWKLKLLFKSFLKCVDGSALRDRYWVDSGTLLGVQRNRGIIPWDDDVDIAIFDEDESLLVELRDVMDDMGLRLKRNRTDAYYQIDFKSDVDQTKVSATNPVHIDVFIFKRQADETYVDADPRFCNSDTSGYKCNIVYSKHLVYPVRKVLFYDMIPINIPSKTDELLNSAFLSGNWLRKGKFICPITNVLIECNAEDYTFA
jgi:hypothetical protein